MLYLVDVNELELKGLEKGLLGMTYLKVNLDQLDQELSLGKDDSQFSLLLGREVHEDIAKFLVKNSEIISFWSLGELKNELKILELDPRYFGRIENLENISFQVKNTLSVVSRFYYERKQMILKLINLQDVMKANIENLEQEMVKSKESHIKYKRKNQRKFKNVSIENYYHVGFETGSEFNDIFEIDGAYYWVNFSTDSYECSSVIMENLENWMHLKLDVDSLIQDFFNAKMNSKASLSFFILKFSDSSLKGELYSVGDYYLCGKDLANTFKSKKEIFDSSKGDDFKQEFNFLRKQGYVLVSPGALRNYSLLEEMTPLSSFINNHIERAKIDIVDEIFIKLMSLQESDFLNYDAHISYLEIKKNAIGSLN